MPLSFPTRSLSLVSACKQARSALHAAAVGCTHTGRTGLDWTGLALPRLCAPQGLERSTPWRACYKVARSKQGITVSLSLTCSNTAIAELTTGSKTLPTDSTNLQVTMQHKSGTALIWRDNLPTTGFSSQGMGTQTKVSFVPKHMPTQFQLQVPRQQMGPFRPSLERPRTLLGLRGKAIHA